MNVPIRGMLGRIGQSINRSINHRTVTWCLQAGLVYSEKGSLSEILCKPKLMPIKSATLIAMENKEKEMLAQVCPPEHCVFFVSALFYEARGIGIADGHVFGNGMHGCLPCLA
jgi:hypothetical protein